MQRARIFCALVMAAAMAGCAASSAAKQPPLHPQQAFWPTYQHSGDRNAVFTAYSIPQDWSYEAKAEINSGLTLVGNTLLFTTFSHKVVALDVRDGRVLWQAPVKNIAMSTPIVADNTVYVGTGKSGLLDRTFVQRLQYYKKSVWGVPGGDEVAAFDLRTGAPRWKFDTVGEDMPSALYDGGRLIFANGDWHAYALRADTGKLLWTTDVGGISTMANAVKAGNAVVVAVCGSDSVSVALDSTTGKILWKSPYGHCDATPAYADGKVFVSDVLSGDTSLQKTTVIAALDARTGKPLWTYRAKNEGLWSIVGSDEVAVAGTYANGTYYQAAPLQDEFIAFDANTGKIRWRFHTSGPAKMSPVVQNGRVYVGDTAGLFYTLDARDGRVLELRGFKKPFSVSPPIIAGNKILVVNGTSVNAIPVTGRPHLASQRVGWGIASASQSDDMSAQ
jgi:outer membrane protein assembly factor BamB